MVGEKQEKGKTGHVADGGKGLEQKPGSTLYKEILRLSIMSGFGKGGYIPASCHNKLPQTECLKITEIIISQFWKPEVVSQVFSRVDSFWVR